MTQLSGTRHLDSTLIFPSRSRLSTFPYSRILYIFKKFIYFRGKLKLKLSLQNMQQETSRTSCECQRNHWMSQAISYKVKQWLKNPFYPLLHSTLCIYISKKNSLCALLQCVEGPDQILSWNKFRNNISALFLVMRTQPKIFWHLKKSRRGELEWLVCGSGEN